MNCYIRIVVVRTIYTCCCFGDPRKPPLIIHIYIYIYVCVSLSLSIYIYIYIYMYM